MRSRAVAYMAFIGTATAFLVSTTIRTPNLQLPFYLVALTATLFVVWSIFQLARVIWPKRSFTLRIDPINIIEQFIDREVPIPTQAELLRTLSKWFGRYIDDNDLALDKVRNAFTQVVLFGSGGLLLWTIAIWFFGTVGTHA